MPWPVCGKKRRSARSAPNSPRLIGMKGASSRPEIASAPIRPNEMPPDGLYTISPALEVLLDRLAVFDFFRDRVASAIRTAVLVPELEEIAIDVVACRREVDHRRAGSRDIRAYRAGTNAPSANTRAKTMPIARRQTRR